MHTREGKKVVLKAILILGGSSSLD